MNLLPETACRGTMEWNDSDRIQALSAALVAKAFPSTEPDWAQIAADLSASDLGSALLQMGVIPGLIS